MVINHGANLFDLSNKLNVNEDEFLDFSSNINPFGACPNAKEAVISNIDKVSIYPDVNYLSLKTSISNYCRCKTEHILLGSGSTELISTFIKIIKPKNALIISPTYSEYERELKKSSCNISYYFAKKEDDRVYSLFKEFLMLFILIAFSMSITFMIGIRGFVSVWVGKENYILSYLTVVLFTSTLFLNIMYYPLVALINADGLFKDNKKHIFICATTNLVLSIILINFFGINGILLGTAIAFLVNILLKTNLVTKKILKEVKLLDVLKYFIITILLFVILSLILTPVESYFVSISTGFISTIIKLGIVFILVTLITMIILYLISNDAKNLLRRILNMLKRKLKK